MKIIKLFGLLLMLFQNGYAGKNTEQKKSIPVKVLCITIPKCGTHLLRKTLSLFGMPRLADQYDNTHRIKPSRTFWALYDKLNKYDPPRHFTGVLDPRTQGAIPARLKQRLKRMHTPTDLVWSHWPYTQGADKFVQRYTRANFFIIRDPRSMLVSMAFMLSKGLRGEETDPLLLMQDFVDARKKHFIRWGVAVNGTYPLLWEYGVVDFYKLYLPWMKANKFHTIRFEDLVGSKGGGSDEAQYKTIKDMANHLGIGLSDKKIKQISYDLFGGSTTFREGRIDGWKKHFSPEMKAAFKSVPGANQLLIDLGYETDCNW
jgi:hypothetical protein